MAAVGEGQATTGSRLLLAAADKADRRPLWISVWGGANSLAQALYDARRERSAADLETLVAKLRVYTISDQDDAGPWLRREFPSLFYIVSPSTTDWKEYWRATWTGISGDRHYKNGPGHQFHLVDNPWLEEHVINGHGPLGALYPKLAYIMEGDTPSFLGLVKMAWVGTSARLTAAGVVATNSIKPMARPVPSGRIIRTAATRSSPTTVKPIPATRPRSGGGESIFNTTLPHGWIGA